jgi:hypothetical protein
MSISILAWLEAEMAGLTENIYRHRGVGAYVTNCERWQTHLEAYQKLYHVLRKPESVMLDENTIYDIHNR